MRRALLALVAGGLMIPLAVPALAQTTHPARAASVPAPVRVWATDNGGLCVQVQSQPAVCSQPSGLPPT